MRKDRWTFVRERGFIGPVAPFDQENPAAHGNIDETQVRRHGTQWQVRHVLKNGRHCEYGAPENIEPHYGQELWDQRHRT